MQQALPSADAAMLGELGTSFANSWSVNGGLSKDELDATVTALYEGEDFASARAVELGEWTDFTLVDEVLAELGTDDSMDPATR
jgi:NitT/TauT family transport system substrate-binding protein